MKRSYKDLISEVNIRGYLEEICKDDDLRYILDQCMTKKDLKTVLSHEFILNKLYKYSIDVLYQANNYDELEYHIMHMNQIFDCASFHHLKKR